MDVKYVVSGQRLMQNSALSWYLVSQPFKSYLSNYKMILTTEEVITIT